jgi:integrase
MAAFLQTLKETAARPIEAMRIQREEVDFVQNHLPIKHPAKNCNPRMIRMTEKLTSMLKTLPINTNGKLFRYKNERVAAKTLQEMRKRATIKLGIPELKKYISTLSDTGEQPLNYKKPEEKSTSHIC